jgi:hypothetical protein
MARPLHFTHPLFPLALNPPREGNRQHALLKGRVGWGDLPFLFSLPHPLDDACRTVLVREWGFQMRAEFQESRPRLFPLFRPRWDRSFDLRVLFLPASGCLNLRSTPSNQLAIGDPRPHRRLQPGHPPGDSISALGRAL